MEKSQVIHIEWEGPYSYGSNDEKDDVILKLDNGWDYGVYQIYGSHPIYGSNVLLYIGKAELQTFRRRLMQETWNVYNPDAGRIEVYIGRLIGTKNPATDDDWNKQISLAEKLLIYAHTPACNTKNLNTIPDDECRSIHILNWGKHRDLLPEVSGARYSNFYSDVDDDTKYVPYGRHGSSSDL